MNQTDVFLTEMMPKLRQAEVALHNGDAGPRSAMWSHDDAATLFGGVMGGTGWAQIEPIFQRLGASFTNVHLVRQRRHRRASRWRPRLHGRLRTHHRLC